MIKEKLMKMDRIKQGSYSVVILCGGRSSRMGQDKAEMQAGGKRMVDRLFAAFSGCHEILLSVRDEKQLPDFPLVEERNREDGIFRVTDPIAQAGPMAGLVATLRTCREEWLFVSAVDMPYMDRDFAEELLFHALEQMRECRCTSPLEKESNIIGQADAAACRVSIPGWKKEQMVAEGLAWDAIVPADREGRLHPLSAFYRKSMLPVLEPCLFAGKYSLKKCFSDCRVLTVPVAELTDGEHKLENLNRPDEFCRCYRVSLSRNQ